LVLQVLPGIGGSCLFNKIGPSANKLLADQANKGKINEATAKNVSDKMAERIAPELKKRSP